MTFLPKEKIVELRVQFVNDPSTLGKIYRAKKNEYYLKSVDHSLVEDMLRDGWEEYTEPLKTKTKLRKPKSHSRVFEDDIWCQMYELGFRCLNRNEGFILPFGKDPSETKQIDVIAVNDEVILLFECKSSAKRRKAPSYKTDFEGLPRRLDGFRKTLEQLYGRGRKLKYIFATKNLRLSSDSADVERLRSTKSFYYNDNTYRYVNNLISKYKGAAFYQFFGIVFKGELISTERIEVPAIEGRMGGKKYYMFSIEPELLLKMGFILHRTEANETELPSYQRLLVPSRLKSITEFIDKGGYFPNSLIINFSQETKKLQFDGSSRSSDSDSRFGTLKIPNAYATAYIIDGQHRLYGYADSKRKSSNTIPVVAFVDLNPSEQLEIFVDINENQKRVSASLRLTLEEDLYWNSPLAVSRMKALRSSIIRVLADSVEGPLYKLIQVGEDTAQLSSKPFADALLKSGLLPKAKGNRYVTETVVGALYDISNQDHDKEMRNTRKQIVALLNHCYGYAEEDFADVFEREKYLLISNRGTYAFISLIASLNKYETEKGNVDINTTPENRFETIKKYLTVVLSTMRDLPPEEGQKLLSMLGSGVETKWLRYFQMKVHESFSDYFPEELEDWMERQDEELQEEGRRYGVAIEKRIKKTVIKKMKQLFGKNWDLEIGTIKMKCEERANDEIMRAYKEGLGRPEIKWTEMFNIVDYKWIIEKHWAKKPEKPVEDFKTFEEEFAIDLGLGEFKSKGDMIKWISVFNTHRKLWAHEGSKEKRLNRKEVEFLEALHSKLNEASSGLG